MTDVSVRDLRNHGGDVLDAVMRGESVTITLQGKPVAELRPWPGAREDSDIDLLVEAPEGRSSFGFVGFKQLIEQVLGRGIDLVSYGGLKAGLDDDVRREAVLL